jgi:U3 small nucleolar RNA-associated protein 10
VIHGLLSGIPSFWGAEEISSVVNVYLSHVSADSTVMANIAKSVAKRVPSNALIPTLCDVWNSIGEKVHETSGLPQMISETAQQDSSNLPSFFTLLKKSLHGAARSDVHNQIRPLFNVFLHAFTIHSTMEEEASPFNPGPE